MIRVSLQCINSSHASYTLLLIGEEAFAAAAALNYSINNMQYWTTETGIQFKLNPPSGHNVMTISTSKDDTDIHLGIFISIIILCLIIGGVFGAL